MMRLFKSKNFMRLLIVSGAAICVLLLVQQQLRSQQADTPSQQVNIQKGRDMSRILYIYYDDLKPEDASRIATMRVAGQQRDHGHIQVLEEALRSPIHPIYPYIAMRALAQLGETADIPLLDQYITGQDDHNLSNYAVVAKARLLAEKASSRVPQETRMTTKVAQFYQALKLGPEQINSGVASYYGPQYDEHGRMYITASGVPHICPVEVFAMRELADMLYEQADTSTLSSPDVTTIAFSRDYGSCLKVRLAAVSREQRVSTLIDELSGKKILTGEDDFEVQLATNLGSQASDAAAARLKEMEVNPQIHPRNGFEALARIVAGVGDPQQAPLIQDLVSKRLVREGPYHDLAQGIKRERVPGY